MKIINKFLYLNSKKTFEKAIQIKLSDQLPKKSVIKFSNEVWKVYRDRSNILTKQKTLGATVMVKYSLFTLIIYDQLLLENIEKEKAMKLTSEITWILYERLTNRFWIFTRLFSKKPIIRVKKAMNFFIKHFPYKSPGYEMKILKTNDDEVAFNVYKCPAAEFFKEKQLSELCTVSWCDLDYPLADKWNVNLKRDKTIAKGYRICDFKFLSKNKHGN